MSLTLVPSNLGLQFSFVATGETGINVESLKVDVKPEIDEYLNGIDGQAVCNAVGDPMGDLAISGEFKSATGVLAAVFVTAFVPTNSTTYFGRSAGGWYLKEGSIDIGRNSWKKVDTKFSSRFNIA